jgi:hypothetical protein
VLIDAAAANEAIGAVGMAKKHVAAIATLGLALGAFMATPVAEGALT